MKNLWFRLKRLKWNIFTLYYASKDPRTPWQAKALITLMAAYIISPVDLLPGFVVPGLGYLDDLALITLGSQFVMKMLPVPVVSEAMYKAMNIRQSAKNWVWFAGLLLVLFLAYMLLKM
ncbi:MAG: DUF1232 domain-containing protein [Desulfotomaculaceae bacterium]|nr:DUF1232 domain-containing protein [Desulfotomaculaceae bacterium]